MTLNTPVFSSHYVNPLVGCKDLFCVLLVHALLTLRTLQVSHMSVKLALQAVLKRIPAHLFNTTSIQVLFQMGTGCEHRKKL